MAEQTKCAHPACQCKVSKDGPFGKYCSESCKEKAEMNELTCQCQHPACR
jgi:hypothetical protein